jgi:hypothetical protein
VLFKSLPQSLLTSSVIVPDNLIAQWIGEVYKHIADGELEFLVLDNKKQSIPPARKLLTYDLVIISHSRFGLESDSGGLEIVGKMSMRIYMSLDPSYQVLTFCLLGISRKCDCPYIGATRKKDCTCPSIEDPTKRYISPLLQVHWKRLIVGKSS